MANSLINVAVLLPLTMLLLVPANFVAGQATVSLVLDKQIFCSTNGNLMANATDIVGAANANVSLRCDNNTIASAVSANGGLVNLNVTVNLNIRGLLQTLLGGNCKMNVILPVGNCTALNQPGRLTADVQVQTIQTQPLRVNVTLSAGNFVRINATT